MPALVPTDHLATVTWLGRVPHRDAREIVTERAEVLELTFAGVPGEVHGGATRPSCSRVTRQYPKGTEIRNVRQVSLLAEEELAQIAARLELDAIDPAWVGATIVLSGLPDFTHLPPSSRLQAEGGATLTVDMLNEPCVLPAMTIAAATGGAGKRFPTAARGLRGITAWVETEGTIRLGERMRLHVPGQRAWNPGGK